MMMMMLIITENVYWTNKRNWVTAGLPSYLNISSFAVAAGNGKLKCRKR